MSESNATLRASGEELVEIAFPEVRPGSKAAGHETSENDSWDDETFDYRGSASRSAVASPQPDQADWTEPADQARSTEQNNQVKQTNDGVRVRAGKVLEEAVPGATTTNDNDNNDKNDDDKNDKSAGSFSANRAKGVWSRRSDRERKAGVIMAVGVVGLLVVQMAVVRPAIERKLVKRAQSVLLLDGSKAVKVSASGRDLFLAGYVDSEEAKKRAVSLVLARRGVRVVDGAKLVVDAGLAAAGGSLSLDPAVPQAAGVPRTGDGAGDQGTVDPGTIDAAQTETAAALEAERSKPMRRAKIAARIADGKVTIEGNVPNEEGRDQLLGRTRQNLGDEQVTDSLLVPAVSEERADLNDYRRVGQLLSIISSLPGAAISLNYDRGTLQISGTVTSNNDLALAQGEIRKLVPDESLRTGEVRVGETPAPAPVAGASEPVSSTTLQDLSRVRAPA
jgi:osmotically-inducible protein OsmY